MSKWQILGSILGGIFAMGVLYVMIIAVAQSFAYDILEERVKVLKINNTLLKQEVARQDLIINAKDLHVTSANLNAIDCLEKSQSE